MTQPDLQLDDADWTLRQGGPEGGQAVEVAIADDRALRRQLADAIEIRGKAEKRAALAAVIADKADEAKCAAALEAERLKQVLDERQAASTSTLASAFITSFKAGEEPPPAISMPPVDSPALTASLVRLRAMHQAAAELAEEANAARGDFIAAANDVNALVDEIMNAEAIQLVKEVIATHELAWRLEDKVSGIFHLDRRRPVPRLRELEEHLKQQADIRKREQASNPQLIERHKWQAHLQEIMFQADAAWTAYARRLALDPAAVFDAPEESTQ